MVVGRDFAATEALSRYGHKKDMADESLFLGASPKGWYLEEIRRRTISMRSFNNPASIEKIAYSLIAYALNHQPDMPMIEFTQNP